ADHRPAHRGHGGTPPRHRPVHPAADPGRCLPRAYPSPVGGDDVTPQDVLAMIRRNRQPLPRRARVTAVTAPPLTVTCRFEDGSPTFQPLVLGTSPVPAVGGRVLVVPSTVGWVYLDTILTPAADLPYQEQYLQL